MSGLTPLTLASEAHACSASRSPQVPWFLWPRSQERFADQRHTEDKGGGGGYDLAHVNSWEKSCVEKQSHLATLDRLLGHSASLRLWSPAPGYINLPSGCRD